MAQIEKQDRVVFWQSKLSNKPKSALAAFNLAVSYHKKKDFSKALKYYKAVIRSKSKLKPVALYYISQVYKGVGDVDRAKSYISQINLKKIPPNLKKRILVYKNSLYADDFVKEERQKIDEKKWNGSFGLGYGFNTNPQFVSTDETSSSASTEGQLAYDASLGYLASSGGYHDFSLNYNGSGRSYASNSISNYGSHEITTPYNHYSSNYRFQLSPSFSHQTYSGKSFSNVLGGTFEIMQKFSIGYLSVGYSYDNINTLSDDYYYLEGHSAELYARWRHLWSRSSLSSTYSYTDNNFQDTDSISPSYEAHQLQLFFSYLGNSSNWNFGISHEIRTYSFDVTENDTRKDSRSSFYVYYGYRLSLQWTIYIDTSYALNNSNFDQNNTDDKNYSQISANTGLRWSF